jgi:hypothetical protein
LNRFGNGVGWGRLGFRRRWRRLRRFRLFRGRAGVWSAEWRRLIFDPLEKIEINLNYRRGFTESCVDSKNGSGGKNKERDQ